MSSEPVETQRMKSKPSARRSPKRSPFEINEVQVAAGQSATVRIPISYLPDHTQVQLTTYVIHGRQDGPRLFVSAAIHGDEIIGVEVIRRLLQLKRLRRLKGTLVLVPVVNAYGFVSQSRYLPDRRDLNRSFPGRETGSLAGQLAHRFMSEVVSQCQYGIDLHTGAIHRANLPQIRADLDNPAVAAMAEAFGASVMLNSNLRDGSLRASAKDVGCNILLYEAGEALRFDEQSIRIGVRGVLGVMGHLGMLSTGRSAQSKVSPVRSDSSHWLRAPIGGLMRAQKALGDRVARGEVLAEISDPLGEVEECVIARHSGVVIGRSNLPLVNRGDALFHVARVKHAGEAEDVIEALGDEIEEDPLFDGIAIV